MIPISRESCLKVSKTLEKPKWNLFQNNCNNKLSSYCSEIYVINKTVGHPINIY
uniref:Uncharacterized protein n=1 Tax=Suricata suricatta TaxID=37032 RepID=A0A673T7M9_SURSU